MKTTKGKDIPAMEHILCCYQKKMPGT